MANLAEAERFCDCKRPIPIVGLGREQLDLHPVFGQRAQRKRGLERSDATPCDQNMSSLATHGPPDLRSIGAQYRFADGLQGSVPKMQQDDVGEPPVSVCGELRSCDSVGSIRFLSDGKVAHPLCSLSRRARLRHLNRKGDLHR